MSDVTTQVSKAIRFQCQHCADDNVTIDFYEGFIHANGGDTGYLTITCNSCKVETNIEGE